MQLLGKLWAIWIILGGLLAAVAVLMAAAGSHIFKQSLNEETLRWFNSANQLHLYHAMALVIVGLMAQRIDSILVHFAGLLLLLGLILFCSVLYVSAIKGVREWLFLAPYGGVSFMLAWVVLAIAGVFLLL